jgi:oligopeptide/dipeptide ABC transporter ATP-binding protein
VSTNADPLLTVSGLRVRLARGKGAEVLRGVDLEVGHGEIVGLVGESGSGKTMTALAVLSLLPPSLTVTAGSMTFAGQDLRALRPRELEQLRGGRIAMIFQDALRHLNPAFTVGDQIAAAIRTHNPGLTAKEVVARAVELLTQVQIGDPERRLRSYPHQFSGGMAQRVMIAMALSGSPELLLADEPTSALDVTVQAEILLLLRRIARQRGMSVLFISHNLGAVWQLCDRTLVMYAGQVVEVGPTHALADAPAHPYTTALLNALPRLDLGQGELMSIPGAMPALNAIPGGCAFHPRCGLAFDACRSEVPPLVTLSPERQARCFLVGTVPDPAAQANGALPARSQPAASLA